MLAEDLAALDHRHLWHPFTPMRAWSSTPPLIIEAGDGNYLIDIHGRRYLDGVSSLWVNVHGHRSGPIDQAVREQLGRVAHSTLLGLSNVPAILLAKRLADIAPPGLTRVFYSDSGSTAVEVALKIAFQYWRNRGQPRKARFITLDLAYHGDTIGAVSLGGIDLFHHLFHPLLFDTLRAPTPHPYRAEDSDPPTCLRRCLDALHQLLEQHAETVAALVIEPRVQGAAGIIVHPPGYLRGVAELCRRYDVLLVCDEVATGFGRTGTLFACQAEDVAPDLLALAKGLTGGYLPLAATLASERIFDAFLGDDDTFFHGHSYTGNPLACAAALASLHIFETAQVLDAARDRASALASLLATRIAELPGVGDVRQCGLMAGIELVQDPPSKAPFSTARRVGARVCMAIREAGVILRNLGDVVVVLPPLSIRHEELVLLVEALRGAILKIMAEEGGIPPGGSR